jgi:hypothetical protein
LDEPVSAIVKIGFWDFEVAIFHGFALLLISLWAKCCCAKILEHSDEFVLFVSVIQIVAVVDKFEPVAVVALHSPTFHTDLLNS